LCSRLPFALPPPPGQRRLTIYFGEIRQPSAGQAAPSRDRLNRKSGVRSVMLLPLAHFRQLRTAAEDGDRRLIKSHHRLPMRPVAVSVQRPPLKDAPGHDNSERRLPLSEGERTKSSSLVTAAAASCPIRLAKSEGCSLGSAATSELPQAKAGRSANPSWETPLGPR